MYVVYVFGGTFIEHEMISYENPETLSFLYVARQSDLDSHRQVRRDDITFLYGKGKIKVLDPRPRRLFMNSQSAETEQMISLISRRGSDSPMEGRFRAGGIPPAVLTSMHLQHDHETPLELGRAHLRSIGQVLKLTIGNRSQRTGNE